jgi:hypothetical protein
MPEVFISYKRERRAAAEHLAETIRLFGYDCWFDYGLIKGRDFTVQLDRKIRESKALVVLWCTLSVGSRWVHEEVDLARSLGILVPAKIEPCELPVGSRLLDSVDLTSWSGSPRGVELDALIDAIAQQVGRAARLDYATLRQYDQIWRRFGAPSMMAFALDRSAGADDRAKTARERDIRVLREIWDELKGSTNLDRLRVFWEQVRDTPVQLLVEERIENLERAAEPGSAGWLKDARPFLSAIRQLYGSMGWSQYGPKADGRDFAGQLRGLVRALPPITNEVSREVASELLREYIATTLHHGLPIPDDYKLEPIIPADIVRPGIAVSYYPREGFGELFEDVAFAPADPRGHRRGVFLQPETRP